MPIEMDSNWFDFDQPRAKEHARQATVNTKTTASVNSCFDSSIFDMRPHRISFSVNGSVNTVDLKDDPSGVNALRPDISFVGDPDPICGRTYWDETEKYLFPERAIGSLTTLEPPCVVKSEPKDQKPDRVPRPSSLKTGPDKRKRNQKVPNCDKCRAKGKVRGLDGCCTITHCSILRAIIIHPNPSFCSFRTSHSFLIGVQYTSYYKRA